MQAQEQAAEHCPSPAGCEVLHPARSSRALIHSLPGLHAESLPLMGRDGWQAFGAGVGDCYYAVYQQMHPCDWW